MSYQAAPTKTRFQFLLWKLKYIRVQVTRIVLAYNAAAKRKWCPCSTEVFEIGDRRSKMSLRFCTLYVATHWRQALFKVAIEFSYTIDFTGLNFGFKYRISTFLKFGNYSQLKKLPQYFIFLLTKLNFYVLRKLFKAGNYSRAETVRKYSRSNKGLIKCFG